MRTLPCALSAVTCLLVGTTLVNAAWAQADVDRATARTLGQEGEKALAAKDYKTAEDDFRRADSLVHAPTLLLGLARALAAEGKLVEAQEAYKRIVREGVAPGSPPVFQRAVDDANKEVQDVSPRVGAVTFIVKAAAGGGAVPGVQVTMDGTPVNAAALGVRRPADPGSHAIHASAPGYKGNDATVSVPVGGPVETTLTLEVDPNATAATTPATTPTTPGATPAGMPDQPPATTSHGGSALPWIAFGVGGAGLILGGITGALALSKHSSLSGPCGSGTCPSNESSDLSSYHTLGTLSTVGFIVAGVGAAAGVTLLLVQPKADSSPAATGVRVTPVVGLGSLGALGTF
jgi:hypothetical protein